MTKSELKNGAVVELRNGCRMLKLDNTLLELVYGEYMKLDDYDDYLLCKDTYGKELDIVKVNNNVTDQYGGLNNALCEVTKLSIWTWERPTHILDEVEKDYLSKICKPYKIVFIKKVEEFDKRQYILIKAINSFDEDDDINLPYFEEDAMYKGMEPNREYTPEELEI